MEYLLGEIFVKPRHYRCINSLERDVNRAKIKGFHNFHGQNIEAWILQIQNDF